MDLTDDNDSPSMLELLARSFPRMKRQDTAKRVETPRTRDKELEGLASLEYYERLTKFARDSTRHWVKGSTTVIDFRPLFAVTIHHLQRQLAQEMQIFSRDKMTDEQLERIGKLLSQYSSVPPSHSYIL